MTSADTTIRDGGLAASLERAVKTAQAASLKRASEEPYEPAPILHEPTEDERAEAVDRALKRAGMPKRYRAASADSGFDEVIASGSGLYIQGPVGCGKTHLACAVAKSYAHAALARTHDKPRVARRIRFVTSIDFLARLKETYDVATGSAESDVMRGFAECDLLILDDLGKDLPTEWAVNRIFQLLNARYNEMLPTLITTQYTPEQLAVKFSRRADAVDAEAIVSRISEMCAAVELGGSDRRIKGRSVYRLQPVENGWNAVA